MARVFAQGTQLQIGDGGSPEVFSTIPNVGEITGPETVNADIEVTDHSSPSQTREYVGGPQDPGELTFPLGWDHNVTEHASLKTDHDARTQRNFQIVDQASPSATYSFTGEVATMGFSFPIEQIQVCNVRIRITGTVTIA